ncbi:uncharacterized protein VP01_11725g1, partial [Puccinia sorghi]
PFYLREIWTDTEIVEAIHKAVPQDCYYTFLLDSIKSSASRHLNPKLSRTRPCTKLDNSWLGPFSISKFISSSAYELILPASFRGIHQVFH